MKLYVYSAGDRMRECLQNLIAPNIGKSLYHGNSGYTLLLLTLSLLAFGMELIC